MRISEINEATMKKHDIGFGLTQYEGTEYSLVGGSRSGSSMGGFTRLRYDIVDHKLHDETDNLNKSKVGFVELFVKDGGNIEGLVNIVLPAGGRKQGLGSSIVKDIADTAGGTLKIYDIQHKAKGFWQKMGAELVRGKPYDAIISI